MSNYVARAIDTPRLHLEPLEKRHAPLMYEALRDERIYTYIPHVAVTTLDALTARFERLSGGRSSDGTKTFLNWALKRRDGAGYAGYVQATVHDVEAHADIGYALVPEAWGFGFATEAVAAMIDDLRAHEIRTLAAIADVRNERSRRLLEKLGFTHVRTDDPDAEYACKL